MDKSFTVFYYVAIYKGMVDVAGTRSYSRILEKKLSKNLYCRYKEEKMEVRHVLGVC